MPVTSTGTLKISATYLVFAVLAWIGGERGFKGGEAASDTACARWTSSELGFTCWTAAGGSATEHWRWATDRARLTALFTGKKAGCSAPVAEALVKEAVSIKISAEEGTFPPTPKMVRRVNGCCRLGR